MTDLESINMHLDLLPSLSVWFGEVDSETLLFNVQNMDGHDLPRGVSG